MSRHPVEGRSQDFSKGGGGGLHCVKVRVPIRLLCRFCHMLKVVCLKKAYKSSIQTFSSVQYTCEDKNISGNYDSLLLPKGRLGCWAIVTTFKPYYVHLNACRWVQTSCMAN